MKRLLPLLFALFAVFFCSSSILTANAVSENGEPEYIIPHQKTLYLAPQSSIDLLENHINIEEFRSYLASQFEEQNTKIDISAFNIPYTNTLASAVFDFIDDEMVEFFHVDVDCAWGFPGEYFSELEISYSLSQSEYEEKSVVWEQTVDKLLEGIKGNSSLREDQKALLLHDRIIIHCEYDYQNYLNDAIPTESYTEYGVIVNGKAVCQGYAEAYQYLLGLVGIDSYICSSDKLNHAWNIVCIDGDYYYVDVTWDDPVWDVSGKVYHNNFLCSYDDFENSHEATDYDRTPNSTKYDEYFWKASDAAFQLVNGEIYYIDSTSEEIKLYDGTVVHSVADVWLAGENSYWLGNYARLYSEGASLIYSLANGIYSYDTVTKESEKVFTPVHDFGEFFSIYGFKYDSGRVICELNSSPKFNEKTKALYTVEGTVVFKSPFIISVGSAAELAGNTVEIAVSISGNQGASEMDLGISYDSSAMTLKGYRSGADFALTSSFDKNPTANTVTFNLSSDSGIEYNGDILILTFEIKEDAKLGKYDIVLTKNKIINSQNKNINCDITQGVLRVLEIGDSSGDGVINTKDVILIAQFVAEWPVDICRAATDCNCDGVINTRDVLLLAQYIAEWGVSLGK